MARRIKTTTTPEERRTQAEALQASIVEQVEQLRDTEQWRRFLDFAQGFHSYRTGEGSIFDFAESRASREIEAA